MKITYLKKEEFNMIRQLDIYISDNQLLQDDFSQKQQAFNPKIS